MIEYARLDLFYKTALMRTVRLLLFALLLLLVVSDVVVGRFPKLPIFFLSIFVMSEIFYRFHIAWLRPSLKVSENSHDALLSCTKRALERYLSSVSTQHLVGNLFKTADVMYFLSRLGINKIDIAQDVPVEKKDVLFTAKEIALQTGGAYITSIDLMLGFLFLTERQTKLLFGQEIKTEDVVLYRKLSRSSFDKSEYPHDHSIHFDGEGFGEGLVTGWTPLTKQFTTDWTSEALYKRRYLFGRENEYKRLIEALSKKENNNVLLVGETGVGKETLLTILVHDSFKGILPSGLNHKRLLELMAGNLLAGASDQGTLEMRLTEIIAEVSHAGDVLLYIPEFQHVLGSADTHLDISGVILPHLQNGRLPIIATMSPGNYKTYLEKNPITEQFSVISLDEPDSQVLLGMLIEKAEELEGEYRCIISLKAIQTALQFAPVFLPDESLPGSAVQLIADAANTATSRRGKRTLITHEDVTSLVSQKTHMAVGVPKAEEKSLLLHLEDKLHQRVVDQVTAVSAISEAMRRVRSGMAQTNKPISFLFLGPTGVGKTETAKALADTYFQGESHIIRLDMSEYADTEGIKRLLGAPPGEGDERGELTDKIHDNPYSLVLLDEFEKAHPTILDLFLQILEDGRLTDNKGRTVSFDNAIIIATSNAASEYIREQIRSGKTVDKAFHLALVEYLQSQHIFKPELLNRFDDVITFTPLGQAEIGQIATMLLQEVTQMLEKQDITLTYSQDVVAKIANEGFDPQFGARPLRRYIQDTIEDVIAKMKLEDTIKRGDIVRLGIDGSQTISVEVGRGA